MKVERIDYIWAAASTLIVVVSFRRRQLPDGILLVYLLMAALFAYHIWKIRRSLKNSVAVYGTITGYHVSTKERDHFPIVKYTTEDGRTVTSTYTVADREERYEIDSEELICYDPQNPMFFYFSGREGELTRDYTRFLIFGAPLALLMLVLR
jgi:hypothetical protein